MKEEITTLDSDPTSGDVVVAAPGLLPMALHITISGTGLHIVSFHPDIAPISELVMSIYPDRIAIRFDGLDDFYLNGWWPEAHVNSGAGFALYRQ